MDGPKNRRHECPDTEGTNTPSFLVLAVRRNSVKVHIRIPHRYLPVPRTWLPLGAITRDGMKVGRLKGTDFHAKRPWLLVDNREKVPTRLENQAQKDDS